MIYTSENNWYKWQYGKGPEFGRQYSQDTLQTFFSKSQKPLQSFALESINAVKSISDHYSGAEISLFFSGGMDSEILLRSCIKAGIKFKTYIVRYNNDYNIYDVSYAITICNILNVEYKIIEFNLENFYENDAERCSELAQIDRPRALPYCKFLELTDGIPVLGASDLSIVRTDDDYSKKGKWMCRCYEHDIGWSKFAREINKQAVPEFFKWTPNLVLSYTKLGWFKKLTHDKYPGKLGNNSTKILGYREAYKDLIFRNKKTGFETIDFLIEEFELFLQKKYNGLPYRQYVDRSINDLVNTLTNI